MRPLAVYIEKNTACPLSIDEIKYTFKTLLVIAGLRFSFVDGHKDRQIDICYGRKPVEGCSLFIKMESIKRERMRVPVRMERVKGLTLFYFKDDAGRGETVEKIGGRTHILNDIILSSFYFLTGWQERFIGRNGRDVHNIEESYLYKNGLLHEPPIDKYTIFLRIFFSQDFEPVCLWPSGKQYAVALSHDVDYPEMVNWIEALRYAGMHGRRANIRKLLDIIGGRESFWLFLDWLELEKKYGMTSAFYFCGFKGSLLHYLLLAPDPFYDVRKDNFKTIMRQLCRDGFEIGMHSSYLAYKSEDMFNAEKIAVEDALGAPVFGNRHHYWHMDPDNPFETALIHERTGLAYDSSLSFERRAGFRRGTSSPFHIYDPSKKAGLEVLQLPPALMDDHLFGHARYNRLGDWKDEVDALIEAVRSAGGVFVTDYHERVLNGTFYPGWRESYEYILKKIAQRDDFYCDTPLNIARHFLERERKILEASGDEDSAHNQ